MSGVPSVLTGDRLLRKFYSLASQARSSGISRRVLEDQYFSDSQHVTLDGQRLVNFTSCGYLDMGTDERLRHGAIDAINRYGTSYSSSPAYSAIPLYEELTGLLTQMVGMPTLLAPTTTLAHLAALPLLIRHGDSVVIDAFCHASVQTALEPVRGAGVPIEVIPHEDLAALDRAIETASATAAGRVWYLADGIYSMHGGLAPFDHIRELLDAIPNLYAYIDDAHGFSWQGLHGRGPALNAIGSHPKLVVAFGMAKSFGSAGGVLAAADGELLDLVELCGGPLSFGGPIPPPVLGAAIASARIHLSEEHFLLNQALVERIAMVGLMAADLGIKFASTAVSPIRFVEVGSADTMFSIVAAMKDDGFYVNGAMFPIVPHGHAGVRFTITRSVTESQIEEMLSTLAKHLAAASGSATSLVVDIRDVEATSVAKRSPKQAHQT